MQSPPPIVIASDEEAKQSPLLHVMQLLKARSDPINQKLALLLAPRNDMLRGAPP
jgi:hypothetical protein